MVLLILPTGIFSIIKFSLFTNLLTREVLTLMDSLNACWAPLITISLFGDSTPLCLKPLTSMSKAEAKPSTNNTQLPEFTPSKTSEKSEMICTEFCGNRQVFI